MIEQIKANVTLRDLFDSLGLVVKGRHIVCPFHDDKRPSLAFKDEGLWYCFVCGFGGDIFNFVMRHENLEFKEALNWLNERFSLGLTNKKPKRNHYLEALNENYKAIKHSLKQEIEDIIYRYHELMEYPWWLWEARDYTFEYTYHDKLDQLEAKLRELENARYKLRRNATQTISIDC